MNDKRHRSSWPVLSKVTCQDLNEPMPLPAFQMFSRDLRFPQPSKEFLLLDAHMLRWWGGFVSWKPNLESYGKPHFDSQMLYSIHYRHASPNLLNRVLLIHWSSRLEHPPTSSAYLKHQEQVFIQQCQLKVIYIDSIHAFNDNGRKTRINGLAWPHKSLNWPVQWLVEWWREY